MKLAKCSPDPAMYPRDPVIVSSLKGYGLGTPTRTPQLFCTVCSCVCVHRHICMLLKVRNHPRISPNYLPLKRGHLLNNDIFSIVCGLLTATKIVPRAGLGGRARIRGQKKKTPSVPFYAFHSVTNSVPLNSFYSIWSEYLTLYHSLASTPSYSLLRPSIPLKFPLLPFYLISVHSLLIYIQVISFHWKSSSSMSSPRVQNHSIPSRFTIAASS